MCRARAPEGCAMSWLRDHFHHFVFPAFVASRTLNNSSSKDIQKFFPVCLPEVPGDKWMNLPSELRKLNALVESLPKPLISKDGYFGSNLYSGYESWSPNSRGKLNFDLIREALLSAESTRKALGCSKLLFAGRDVWAFEVMAQKRGIDSLFIPEISRKVVQAGQALKKLMDEYKFTGNELLVDTGFAGSIPRNINANLGCNLKFILLSQDKISSFMGPKNDKGHIAIGTPDSPTKENERALARPNQVFPNRANVRGEALEIEYLPKYWASGTITELQHDNYTTSVIQYLARPEEIIAAAFLTSNIWRGVKYGRKDDGSYMEPPPKEERKVPFGIKKHKPFYWL